MGCHYNHNQPFQNRFHPHNKSTIELNIMLYCIGKRVLVSTLFVLFIGNVSHAQFRPDQRIKYTSSGKEKVTLTEQEWLMAGIKYLEKKNNNWYERFWIEEGFTSPGDIYVQLLPSTAHAEGIVVVFDLSEEVIKKDSTLEIHERIAEMLFDQYRGYVEEEWPVWMAGYRVGYTGDPLRANMRAYNLFIPKDNNLDELPAGKGIGNERITMPVNEYVLKRMHLAVEDLRTVYKDFLDLSGLEIGYDARLSMGIDSKRDNVINVEFWLNEQTQKADPNLKVHRDMADRFVKFLERKSKPYKPDWLFIKAIADTTNGRRLPVVLK